MGDRLVEKLIELRGADESETEQEIVRLLTSRGRSASSVQDARDDLRRLLAEVQDGNLQLVGQEDPEMVVVISIRDLAALITSPAAALSFGSALDEVGFKPLGRRIRIAPEEKVSRPIMRERPT